MTNVNPENEYQGAHRRAEEDDYDQNYEAAPAAAFPKRGVAMILLAVAALLLLWGIYAMNKGDGQEAAAPGTTEATTAQATQATTAVSAPASPSEQATEEQKPTEQEKPAEQTQPAEQPAPAPAGLAREQAQVYVYNLSLIHI